MKKFTFLRKLKAWFIHASRWVALDGLLHCETCFVILAVCAALLRIFMPKWLAVLTSLCIAVLAAIGKEWYDYHHPDKHSASWHDIIMDAVGIVAAVLAAIAL